MKTRILGTLMLSALMAGSAIAQQVENDDMYFNSADRKKLSELNAKQTIASTRKVDRKADDTEELNPTDSYSARTVNPEYSSRSNAETATSENEDYYVNNYRYQTANELRTFNNNFNNWYGSTWYSRNYWGPSIYSWNSPFYGDYYSAWGSPWNNPYYAGTYSSSFSYYYGNNWDYRFGYSSYWNYPISFWGTGWGPSFNFGYSSWFGPASWYGYGYPRVVVINNSYGEANGQKVVYGKRPSRSSEYATANTSTRTRSSYTPDTGSGRTNSGGRAASTEYYNKSWRYTSPANTGSTSGSNTTTRTRTSSYSSDNSRSSWGNSNNSYNSNSSYNSRSSSSSYGSSGSRSTTPSSSGGSNGRSRGSR